MLRCIVKFEIKKRSSYEKNFIILGIVFFSTSTLAKTSGEIGLGYNYGGYVGYVTNVDVNSNTALFAGTGVVPGSLGFVAGAKFWLNDNVRLTTNYGTNCIISGTNNSYEGLNFGVGYAFGGRKEGVSIDLMLLDWTECNKHATNITDTGVLLSIGYRFKAF